MKQGLMFLRLKLVMKNVERNISLNRTDSPNNVKGPPKHYLHLVINKMFHQ